MREQLKDYVDLLFAGAQGVDDIKQEILQNTLDRYDDLVSQSKSPEAAYRLAISGIGDINEILGAPVQSPASAPTSRENPKEDHLRRRKTAAAIAMYILCPIPLVILGETGNGTLGLCLLLLMVAAATALLISAGKEEPEDSHGKPGHREFTPQAELRHGIASFTRIAALAVFLILSLLTGAWYITWLVFPIAPAVRGVIFACIDLKEAN